MARSNTQESSSANIDNLNMYIGGEWTDSESGERRTATSPATGEEIASLPAGTREDARRAIDAARSVQEELEFMSDFERAELVHAMADALENNIESLSKWLTRDQGKPRASEAHNEIEIAVGMFREAAEGIKRAETEVIPSENSDKRMFTIRKPHGVYAVITPWNFPCTIPSEYIAPGIAAGNAIAWAPAPTTSAFSVKFMEALTEADLPDGALNLVLGEGPVVGDELVANDGTDAVGFTGSPETGEQIAERAGAKPTLLELGGNGPVIVLDDADLEAAVECTAQGCVGNAGQICTSSERILVHEDVHDEFIERLDDRLGEVELGDPRDESTTMGPLNNEAVADKMDRHVSDALEKGAELVRGGERATEYPTSLYYKPTLLTHVTPDMTVNEEETFGPIAPIISFSDYDEALEITNSSPLGLSAGVFTSNIDLMYYFVERVQTGIVNVNEGSAYWETHTPAGGYSGTDSGVGRIGGRYTIEEMTQVKNVSIDLDNLQSPRKE